MAAKINISQDLLDAVKGIRKRISYPKRLDALVLMIDEGGLTLPIYQRDASWTIDKCIDLFNFQLLGKALISPISIYEFKVKSKKTDENKDEDEDEDVKQIRFNTREEIDLSQRENETIQSVVDGQQRLTTNYKAYKNHPDFKDIIFDVVRGKFRLNAGKTVLRTCIPVGILYHENEIELENYLREKGTFDQLYSVLTRMRSRWAEYQYTLNIANDMTEAEQIEWFEVLNNAGSRVTDVQIKLSKIKLKSGEDFDIYKNFTKVFINKLTTKFPNMEKNFRPFATRVSYPIASLNPAYEILKKQGEHGTNFATIPSDEKSKTFGTENIDLLIQISDLTLANLDKALDFIKEFNLESYVTRMDYILYLVGYFVFRKDQPLNDFKVNELIKWVQIVDFNNKTNHERREEYTSLINKALI